jgi:hypothetical protein
MSRMPLFAVILATLVAAAPEALADTINATLSSPQDLSHLTVGELVTIDVNLQGLVFGSDFIYDLDTKVVFSSSLFQSSGLTTSYGPASGYAFYYSGQPPAFFSTSSLGAGDAVGIFNNSVSAPPINQNGIFYSFTLEAIATGSGSISFDNSVATDNQYASNTTPNFFYIPLPTSSPMSVSISSVPEPSSLGLGVVASLVGFGLTWRRHRRVMNSAGRIDS